MRKYLKEGEMRDIKGSFRRQIATAGLLAPCALAIAPLLWASAANADLINMGGSPGTMTFSPAGSGTLGFTTTGFSFANADFEHPNGTVVITGTASLSAMTGTTGTESGGIFPIVSGGMDTFTFTATGGASGSMSGTVTWPGIKDGTSSPQFDDNALLTVTSNTVTNANFDADFPVNGHSPIDFTLNLTPPTTLATVAGEQVGGPSATATFSSGEVVPAPVIGHGLFVLLAVGGVLFGGKLFENLKKRQLQAA
jgi:hypothetical protein